jgi:hypothetical protein
MSAIDHAAKTLSIGMIVGGRTLGNRAWVEAIQQLMTDVIEAREGIDSDINVNVEFQVPGNLLTPEFDGVRTGAFRKADSLLKVQAALPADVPAQARPILLGFLRAALDAVDSWAIAKKRTVDTSALRGIVAAVEASDR